MIAHFITDLFATRIIYLKKRYTEINLNPYSAGIDFSRQNLTSVDVTIKVKIFIMAVDP